MEFHAKTDASNCRDLVKGMLTNLQGFRASMGIKIHYLFNYFDCSPGSLGDVSEQQSERFHQNNRKNIWLIGHSLDVKLLVEPDP